MAVEIPAGMRSPETANSVGLGDQLRALSGLLTVACLFAVVGGYLDAYAYLAHGHVFANAQTGNVVLLAVHASAGDWPRAVRHLPPILAFVLGVTVAKLLGVQTQKQSFRATLCCEAFELAILSVLAVFGGNLPDASVVPLISFVAAIQNTSLSAVGPWSFNSVMTTGNLRDATSGLVLWLTGRQTERGRGQAIVLGLICLSFLAGALAGGI